MLNTPLNWRKDWSLFHSQTVEDSRGNESRKWDMEHPDFVGHAGTASGVCWQIKSSEWAMRELGEQVTGAAAFDLFLENLPVFSFDRCILGGMLWEVRAVIPRSNHRHIQLVEVKQWESK